MKVELVPISRIVADANNPRKDFSDEQRQELAASILAHGIKVPLIGYVVPGGVMLGDGHCRLEAAKAIGLAELPVIVFPTKPDEAELLSTQLTINGHRHALNPVDEWEAFVRLAKLKGWSSSELASGLAVSNAEVTRVLAIGKLSCEERDFVRQGRISKSAAYALSRMRPEQRTVMVQKVASGEGVTRDQLNSQARRKKKGEEVRTQRVSCCVAGGTVSVQAAQGLDLGDLVDLLEHLVRECKKLRSQGLDISTVVAVLRDRARAQSAG